MKLLIAHIIAAVLFSLGSFAQVSVTNPGNTTPALAATYPTLADAIIALNTITSISGPVVFTLLPASPQTAPAGGYAIEFAAATSAVNTIEFNGSGNIITAFTPQPSGNLNDAIFKLIGVDYVTISSFIMQENGANSTMARVPII